MQVSLSQMFMTPPRPPQTLLIYQFKHKFQRLVIFQPTLGFYTGDISRFVEQKFML
jgi:hypothetical protein